MYLKELQFKSELRGNNMIQSRATDYKHYIQNKTNVVVNSIT